MPQPGSGMAIVAHGMLAYSNENKPLFAVLRRIRTIAAASDE